MLEQEAATVWDIPAAELETRNHEFHHAASGRSLGFGDVARGAAERPAPPAEALRFKTPDQYRYTGKENVTLAVNHGINTGRAV